MIEWYNNIFYWQRLIIFGVFCWSSDYMTQFTWNGSSGELKDLCEYEQMAEKKNFLRGGWVGRLMSLPPTDVQHRFPLVKLGPAGQKKEMIMMAIFCNGIFSFNFFLFYSQIGSILCQQFRALTSHLGNSTLNQISWHTFVTAVFTQMEKLGWFRPIAVKALPSVASGYPSVYLCLDQEY